MLVKVIEMENRNQWQSNRDRGNTANSETGWGLCRRRLQGVWRKNQIKCCVGKEQREEIGMSMCGRRSLRYKDRCIALRAVSFILLSSLYCVLLTCYLTTKWEVRRLKSTPSWFGRSSSRVTEREEDKEKEKNNEPERNTDEHKFQRYVTER